MRFIALIPSIIAAAVATQDGKGPEQLEVAGLLQSKKDEGDIRGRKKDEGNSLLQVSNMRLFSLVGESSAVKELRSNDSDVSLHQWFKKGGPPGMSSRRKSLRRRFRPPRRRERYDPRKTDAHKVQRGHQAARIDGRDPQVVAEEEAAAKKKAAEEEAAAKKKAEIEATQLAEAKKQHELRIAALNAETAAHWARVNARNANDWECKTQQHMDWKKECDSGNWGASQKGGKGRAQHAKAEKKRLGKGFTTTKSIDPWQNRRRGCAEVVVKDCFANWGKRMHEKVDRRRGKR